MMPHYKRGDESIVTTHYEILGVSKNATADEIKQAFRDKAKIYHPDVSKAPNAQEQFIKIAEAYNILRDSRIRADYDRFLDGSKFTSNRTQNQRYSQTNQNFERARQRVREQAEMYAVISLDELLNTLLGIALDSGKSFLMGDKNRIKTTFFDYLKMGFLGFLLTFSIILSFTGIGTLPGIVVTFLLVNSIFKNKRFIGVIPFIISALIFNFSIIIFLVILILIFR